MQLGAVPGVDACFVDVDDGDGDIRALECDNGVCRAACEDGGVLFPDGTTDFRTFAGDMLRPPLPRPLLHHIMGNICAAKL
jgi:hypothetical protein